MMVRGDPFRNLSPKPFVALKDCPSTFELSKIKQKLVGNEAVIPLESVFSTLDPIRTLTTTFINTF